MHRQMGPALVREFVSALRRNSRAHLDALRLLILSDDHIEPAVRQQVWETLNERAPLPGRY